MPYVTQGYPVPGWEKMKAECYLSARRLEIMLLSENGVIEPHFSFFCASARMRNSLRRASALDFW